MFEALVNKEKTIAVLGLGYVGLPLALTFAQKFRVIGFDVNSARIDMMKQQEDPSQENFRIRISNSPAIRRI